MTHELLINKESIVPPSRTSEDATADEVYEVDDADDGAPEGDQDEVVDGAVDGLDGLVVDVMAWSPISRGIIVGRMKRSTLSRRQI